ncbi:hypothetical protein VOLCADRAFT_95923 [Volvox carteri f. nagariensis]|uniref:Uncharacterized protein mot17 n=1 Tax=Volvox carteri f. nagariensis TaxID=3068 RepID=D8U8Q6_VOLCA|nr:uncharacterized protein VOLCADRAFT_95923 [Volvox carteri f. nagariensis]EFJ43791.1 hypothetical protein VOLCADRAFT_95923 [Volvox carteri f. nagariensis]|eukprot:XP_002955037.1 hypothetical protein VOLCADRAFT_95923 [Volvox carteri f. nagariensis]
MAALAKLQQVQAQELIDEYFSKCRAYFNAMATIIQRWWRGYYSRKNIHNYYARKRYLQQIKERNQHIRAELNLEAERAIIMQRQEAEERARKLFADKLSKLHHLVSTSVQPGIFNSPYSIATGTLPVIMGLTVEEHLKSTIKAQLGLQPDASGGGLSGGSSLAGSGKLLPPLRGSSKGRVRSGSAGRSGGGSGTGQRVGDAPLFPAMVEVAGRTVPARYTLRQTADFEAVHREALMEEKIHRGEVGSGSGGSWDVGRCRLERALRHVLGVVRSEGHRRDAGPGRMGNRCSEKSNVRRQMLSHHPQAFANALGAVKAPFFDLQTNRNLIPYDDPYDPTVGMRGPRFTPDQQAISKSAFNRYIKRQHIFDKNMAAEAY